MKLQIMFVLPVLIWQIGAVAQPPTDPTGLTLAHRLADYDTRAAAVASVTALGNQKIALLLSWARNPPPQVDKSQLFVGMADVLLN
jgi:hypothetical protein